MDEIRLIDANALKEDLKRYFTESVLDGVSAKVTFNQILHDIDNAPTVEFSLMPADETKEDAYKRGYEKGKIAGILKADERPQGEWIPITYRPLTVKERIEFAKHYGFEYCDTSEEKTFDCPMPEDGQKILISTLWGVVEDVADNDIDEEGFICYGLERNGDWDGVEAWMPKPERYKKGGAK